MDDGIRTCAGSIQLNTPTLSPLTKLALVGFPLEGGQHTSRSHIVRAKEKCFSADMVSKLRWWRPRHYHEIEFCTSRFEKGLAFRTTNVRIRHCRLIINSLFRYRDLGKIHTRQVERLSEKREIMRSFYVKIPASDEHGGAY